MNCVKNTKSLQKKQIGKILHTNSHVNKHFLRMTSHNQHKRHSLLKMQTLFSPSLSCFLLIQFAFLILIFSYAYIVTFFSKLNTFYKRFSNQSVPYHIGEEEFNILHMCMKKSLSTYLREKNEQMRWKGEMNTLGYVNNDRVGFWYYCYCWPRCFLLRIATLHIVCMVEVVVKNRNDKKNKSTIRPREINRNRRW